MTSAARIDAVLNVARVEAGLPTCMQLLGARVDALTMAYRVRLDPGFVAALAARSLVAREHGRAAFEWLVRAPDEDVFGKFASRRVGPLRLRWADEVDRTDLVSKLWGELRYSKQQKTWFVVNEPFFRLKVDPRASGGEDKVSDCGACKGRGHAGKTVKDGPCSQCDGRGVLDEPGWTIEVIWYAQTLADWGLERTIAESHALASNVGEVLEARLRRIDLCADIQGWTFSRDDADRLAKRPQTKWTVDDDGVPSEGDYAGLVKGVPSILPRKTPRTRRRTSKERLDDGAQVYGVGSGEKRRVTGISVGRGGALMCRIYDKRVELERHETYRALEEERWTEQGWDGESPVTRVEFQIRGVALHELGLRDPDACVEPVTKEEEYVDARGKIRMRTVVVGQRVVTTESGEQATIVHRLDDLWHGCLNWVRLIVPETTRSGASKPNTRCPDDPRWALLRDVKFNPDAKPRAVRRYRARGAASAAQALGVTISQTAREGGFKEALPEDRAFYATNEERSLAQLRSRVHALKTLETERILKWMIEKFGGPAGAAEHFAVRVNAARARFHHGVECVNVEERGPPNRVEDVRAVA